MEGVCEKLCLVQSLRNTVRECYSIQCRQSIAMHDSMGGYHMSALHDMHTNCLAADVTSESGRSNVLHCLLHSGVSRVCCGLIDVTDAHHNSGLLQCAKQMHAADM